jgi:Ca2+-binding RTX toxin-like protein
MQAWRNTGSGFTALTGTANPLDVVGSVDYSMPAFVDLDGDGDLDLVAGEMNGTLLTWRNTAAPLPAITVTVTAQSDAPAVILGTAVDDLLFGGSDADSISGLAGNDTAFGGAGNDVYTVDSAGDVVTEQPGGGTDLILASLSWTLGAEIEQLTLTGRASLTGTGNALDNRLVGNTGANLLSGEGGNDSLIGGAGADTLVGGAGNDVFTVDSAGDVVVELSGGGIDQVAARISWTLGAEIEQLTLAGSANLTGTGNALDNRLVGNTGANLLSGGDGNDSLTGGAGADTLVGGAGNDIYEVDSTSDLVVELSGGGIDLVISNRSWTLGAEIEQLTLTGSASLTGTGNGLDNRILGNGGTNLLAGGDGNDSLSGGGGADTLIGGAGVDRLDGGFGTDSFRFLAASEGGDAVIGFASGQDRIELSASGFGGGLAQGMGLGATGRFVVSATGQASTPGLGQVVWQDGARLLWWDADGAAGADAVLLARMSAGTMLFASDFAIIA